jgi:hypothetical protein
MLQDLAFDLGSHSRALGRKPEIDLVQPISPAALHVVKSISHNRRRAHVSYTVVGDDAPLGFEVLLSRPAILRVSGTWMTPFQVVAQAPDSPP